MADENSPPWSAGPESTWEVYWRVAESHRETVTSLIIAALSEPRNSRKVCLWGVGSCHDVDLPRLLDHCDELSLVDVHTANVLHGVEYQLKGATDRIKVIAPLDLAGIAHGQSHDAFVSAVSQHRLTELGEYDVIASLGMLSQIVLDVAVAYGVDSAAGSSPTDASLRSTTETQVVAAMTAVRRRHLALMAEHLKPGGRGVAVIDLINSSDTPKLADGNDFESVVQQALEDLPGPPVLLPQRMHHDLMVHPVLSRRVTDVSVSSYWLWRMPKMSFACYATCFTKR